MSMLISKLNYRAVAFVLLLLPVSVVAQAQAPEPARILVSGEGSAEVAPDMAILQLTVNREADTARAALDANSAAMAEVLRAMQAQGIEKRDLQTANFSIQPRYHHPRPKPSGERQPPQITGYIVRNSLTVRVRDISRVGVILDESVTLGVNEGGNITFTNADPAEVIKQARINAVADARAKAATLAQAAEVKLGKVLQISEQSYRPGPMPVARAEMAMARSANDSVPVATGENSYRITVQMSFAIDQ
jgi:uncharacterized protein YggE